MRNILILVFALIALQSCQIKEEIQFNEDGSGTYEMGFDMSEMLKMGQTTNDSVPSKVVDTLINFSTFLDEKKDSIASLSLEEQEKLELLRPLQFSMNANEAESQMKMDLKYAFTTIDDISKFGEAIKLADIKELNEMMNPMGGKEVPQDSTEKKDDMDNPFAMSTSFETRFSKTSFSRKMTTEAIEKAMQKKDTTMKKDDPFADAIRFKQVYKFPYKVKSVSNPNAKILSNFMGIEIEANMFEMNNDPKFFNVEVEFEE